MQVVELQIFQFHELDEQAKQKAREWYRQDMDFNWNDESQDSINAFCDHFRVKLINWSIAPYCSPDYHADYFNSHFRGMKLKDFNRDHMPTGYCLDADLWESFYDEFKKTGDAKHAFEQALEAALCAVQRDIEYHYSDEAVDESLRINEYEFNSNGSIFTAKEMEIA